MNTMMYCLSGEGGYVSMIAGAIVRSKSYLVAERMKIITRYQIWALRVRVPDSRCMYTFSEGVPLNGSVRLTEAL
jgi:hypothetical protein